MKNVKKYWCVWHIETDWRCSDLTRLLHGLHFTKFFFSCSLFRQINIYVHDKWLLLVEIVRNFVRYWFSFHFISKQSFIFEHVPYMYDCTPYWYKRGIWRGLAKVWWCLKWKVNKSNEIQSTNKSKSLFINQ